MLVDGDELPNLSPNFLPLMFCAICYVLIILLFHSVVVTVSFNESVYSVNEDDGTVQTVLVLSSPPAINIIVHVSSTGGSAVDEIIGSAVDDADYKFEICDVTFQSGTTNAILEIAITNDTVWEPNEDFTLTINASLLPSNVNVAEPGSTTVTIMSDDGESGLILFVRH